MTGRPSGIGRGPEVGEIQSQPDPQFHALLQQFPEGAYTCDRDGLITYYNEQAVRLWGREPKLRDESDRYCGSYKLFALDGTPIDHEDCWMALALKRDRGFNRRAIIVERPDGTRRMAMAHANPIHDKDGRLLGAVNVLVDTTERERTEEALQRAEAGHRVLFETLAQGVVYQDEGARITHANPAAERILGLGMDAMQGSTLTDPRWQPRYEDGSVVPERQHPSAVALRSGAEVRDVAMKISLPGDRGSRWIRVSAVPLYGQGGGMPVQVYTTFEDITDRRQAEEAVRRSERRFRALVQNASDIVTVLDPDGTVTYQSPSVERLLGYAPEDLVGHSAFDFVHPDDVERVRGVFGRLVKSEKNHGIEEVRFRHADGSWRYLEGIANNRLDDAAVGGVVVNSRDVTDRRVAEQKLQEVRESERSRLARDLHDEALQDMTYALAEVQLVETMAAGSDFERRLARAADALMRAGQGLRSAIYDLRLDHEDERPFAEMLERLVEYKRRSSRHREITLRLDRDALPELDRKTEMEVLRIIREAMVNAQRHSHADHIRVEVSADEERLWAEVSDDGVGFDPSTATIGMGVYGMRDRARVVGGELDVRSEPGGGTTVRFELPLDESEEEAGEIRILLVDDHASLRQAVATVFEREPEFTVVGQAGTLSAARESLAGVDVAIVDLTLPDGHGGDLIREIREANPKAMTLVLSATSDRADVARAVEAGAAGVLHKSAGMDEVVDAVRRLRAGETLLPLEEVVDLLRFAGVRRDQEHEARRAIAQLTPREREVLHAVAEGLDGKEISRRLNISLRTERNHMASILSKLGVNSRLQALVFALRHGVVEVA